MKKLVINNIKTCEDCPYFQYDPYYSMSTDSGYDCKKESRRIIDDADMMEHVKGVNRYKNEPIKIPEWCPLSNS
jgi:hypothetical protein